MRSNLMAALLVLLGSNLALPQTTVIRAKRIYTVTKGIIEDGAIVIRGGKIQAVGKGVETPPPTP